MFMIHMPKSFKVGDALCYLYIICLSGRCIGVRE
jgi:hypothetical protein